jgi:hypothetical protein
MQLKSSTARSARINSLDASRAWLLAIFARPNVRALNNDLSRLLCVADTPFDFAQGMFVRRF